MRRGRQEAETEIPGAKCGGTERLYNPGNWRLSVLPANQRLLEAAETHRKSLPLSENAGGAHAQTATVSTLGGSLRPPLLYPEHSYGVIGMSRRNVAKVDTLMVSRLHAL